MNSCDVLIKNGRVIDPAWASGWDDRIGTLGQGRDADVAVFAIEAVDMDLEDCQSQMRRASQLLVPKAVWRAGEPAVPQRAKSHSSGVPADLTVR
ncbi:MAG: hypothetical protein QGF67_17200 [Lentisphaeria bacterium]|jgi:predicted amidohydrolase|nr:hypothetical protein [Lentisphaeria bacterium]MDP7743179.1 hypothetical protein [Lentisphaeria bacterium]